MFSWDGIESPDRVYLVWLAAFVTALALALLGVWCWVCRSGRIGRVSWSVWTLVSLAPAAFCGCDVCRRLDVALTEPAALAVKAILIALVLAASCWFALGRQSPHSSPVRARRLSWPLIVGNATAAVWASGCFHQAVGPVTFWMPPLPPVTKWVPLAGAEGVTDRGSPISLLVPENAPDFQHLAMSVYFGGRFSERLIELEAPDNRANCHGWVFTGGWFGIAGEDVGTILMDNDYDRIEQPRPGDLVIYRDTEGRVAHSGIVRLAEGDLVLVESKSGAQARYLHRLLDQAYATTYEFYRSPRHGHFISLGQVKAPVHL